PAGRAGRRPVPPVPPVPPVAPELIVEEPAEPAVLAVVSEPGSQAASDMASESARRRGKRLSESKEEVGMALLFYAKQLAFTSAAVAERRRVAERRGLASRGCCPAGRGAARGCLPRVLRGRAARAMGGTREG